MRSSSGRYYFLAMMCMNMVEQKRREIEYLQKVLHRSDNR